MDDDSATRQYQAQVRELRDELQALRDGAPLEDANGRPRRVTNSEVLRAFLARMQSAGGEHSTVRLARNARGDTQIEVSVRTGETPGLETIEAASAKAREIYDALRMLYPMQGPSE